MVQPNHRKKIGLLACFGLAGLVGAWFLATKVFDASNQPTRLTVPAPITPSRFLNTTAKATFVGTEACSDCHKENYDSYLKTAHSLALDEIDLKAEPPDAELTHELTGRSYRIYRQGSDMRHQESIKLSNGETLVTADYRMSYVIGSGNHSRSYLIDIDGFLVESPLTWYTSHQEWRMSPGYDRPDHFGFSRPVTQRCLSCHAGLVEPIDGSLHRLKIHQQSIGCENCHGPGSLHVDKRMSGDESSDRTDLTIVNPHKLTREQQESICAQCHLGNIGVEIKGRHRSDFRPGQSLKEFATTYQFEVPNKSMKVDGHVAQMRLSRCYVVSETMTCTTCHDPHVTPAPQQRLEFYRAKCMSCHTVDACGLTQAERHQKSQTDDCMSCHMPKSPTDIPHTTFTHHRVARHTQEQAKPDPDIVRSLVPMHDVSHLPKIEQERSLGLAYHRLLETAKNREQVRVYRGRAIGLLEGVRKQGRDPDVESALARIYATARMPGAKELAESALELKGISSWSLSNALIVAAQHQVEANENELALKTLDRLLRIRQYPSDLMLLGRCYYNIGNRVAAIEALTKAVKLDGTAPEYHHYLGLLYSETGKQKLAAKHKARAQQLANLQKKSRRKNAP